MKAGDRHAAKNTTHLEAITELVLAGRGNPVTAREEVLSELTAWAAHRIAAGRHPDGDEESAAGSAGPVVPRVDAWRCRMCWAPRSVVSLRPSSPTRPGWPRWA